MNAIAESMKGFTDLPIAALCFIFGGLAWKMKSANYAKLFCLVGVAAVLGSVVHVIAMPALAVQIIWTFLYPLLFESVRYFSELFSAYNLKDNSPLNRPILLAEILLCLGCLLCLWIWNAFDMLFLILFAVICGARIVAAFIRSPEKRPKAILIMASFPFAIIFQTLEEVMPYSIVGEHIVFMIMLVDVYLIAKETVNR